MQCNIRIVYQNKETFLESNENIDFRFLRERFGIELSKDTTRNPLILTIQIRDNSEIWISKNSFTTAVNVKFTEKDVYTSLYVSDGFTLENKAFLKIEKFELMFENVMKQYPREIQNTPSIQDLSFSRTYSPFQALNTTQMNNSRNIITPPPKTNNVNTQGIAVDDDEDSESLWDYVDDLLKAESQSSFKQASGTQSFMYNEPSNQELIITKQALEPSYGGPKETPKKENLMSQRRINYCMLDLEEEDEIEALLMQKKQKSEENSREYNMLSIVAEPQRPQSPMVIEQPRPFINILTAPEPEVESDKIIPETTMIQESPRMTSSRIEIEEQKTPVERRISQHQQQQFSQSQRLSLNFNQPEEHKTPIERRISQQHFSNSQRLSLNQNQSQNFAVFKAFSQHSSQKKNELQHSQSQSMKHMSPSVSKSKQLQQLIEEKRVESAKNSAMKTPPKQAQESRDCSICLCDIDEGGKINSCTHQFCFTCIHDWSKITNQCPLCKGRFDIIEKFSSDGNLLDTIPVVFKQQVYEDENLLEEMDDNCYECENGDDDAHLLVCDNCGFFCCHTYCCVPAYETVPLEDWYCKFCLPSIRRNQRRGQNNGNTNTTTTRRNGRATQAAGTAGTGSRRNSRRPNTGRQGSLENFVVEERPRNRNRTEIEEEPPRANNRSNRSRRNTSNRTVITIIEDADDVPILPRNTSRNQRRLVV